MLSSEEMMNQAWENSQKEMESYMKKTAEEDRQRTGRIIQLACIIGTVVAGSLFGGVLLKRHQNKL